MKNGIIVLVDDEENFLMILKEVLEQKVEERVEIFLNPELAIEFIKKESADIVMIFSDMKMPQMSGLDLRKKMLPELIDIPFVVVTGFNNKEITEKGMEYGVRSFLDKTADKDEILRQYDLFSPDRKAMINDDKEMKQSFIEESYPMLDEIEDLILDLEDGGGEEALKVFFRLLHTIKGTSACVGLDRLAAFSHKYEDFISDIIKGEITVNTKSIDVILHGVDKLKGLFSHISSFGNDSLDVSEDIKTFEAYEEGENTAKNNQKNTSEKEEKKLTDGDLEKEFKEDEKLSVPMSALNHFMEQSGELTIIRNAILKTISKLELKMGRDSVLDDLNDLLVEMQEVTGNVQSVVSQMRKVSISKVFKPYKRLVRDLSKSLGKEIHLEIKDNNLYIDSNVAKLLANALIHLVRNSIDHGIETVERRKEVGKNPQGSVTLFAQEVQDQIIVKIIDDGKGLSRSALEKKAAEKELYTLEEMKSMPDRQIFNFIFESGFSTAEQVTDLSGRGVGMDMVRSSLRNEGGNVIIDSEEGNGCVITMSIPVPKSIMIINSILCEIENNKYILPMDEVVEILDVKGQEEVKVKNVDGKEFLYHYETLYDMLDIKSFFFNKEKRTELGKTILVRTKGDTTVAIKVDEILGFEEVVVRKLNPVIKNAENFVGASLIGDGDLGMILNVEEIISKMNVRSHSANCRRAESQKKQEDDNGNSFVCFTLMDTQKQKFALNLDDIYRLEKIEKKDISFLGTKPVIRYQEKVMPLLSVEKSLGLSSVEDSFSLAESTFLDVIVVKKDKRYFGIMVKEVDKALEKASEIFEEFADRKGILGVTYVNDKSVTVLDINYIVTEETSVDGESNYEVA